VRGKVVLRAADLDGYLTEDDEAAISELKALYDRCLALYPRLDGLGPASPAAERSGRA
jgi:hypothetical protein